MDLNELAILPEGGVAWLADSFILLRY